MGLIQALVSQGARPRGVFGWVVAWTYQVLFVLFRSQYAKVAGLLDLQAEDEVLDVACGSGMFLQKYASHVHRVAGLDHSEIQIRIARRQNRDRIAAGTAEFVQGDAAALPWEDNRFSAVTCNSLSCFANPAGSLEEMHRVLLSGGRILILDSYCPDDKKAQKAEQRWGLPVWNETELRTMMEDAGFSQLSLSHERSVMFATAIKQQ